VGLTPQSWEYAWAWNHGQTIGARNLRINPELKAHYCNKAVLRALLFEESAGRWGEAEGILQRVLDHEPNHGGAMRNIGRIQLHQGKLGQARHSLERYLGLLRSLRLEDSRAVRWMGEVMRRQGAHEEAAAYFARALKGEPKPDWFGDRDFLIRLAAEAAFRWN